MSWIDEFVVLAKYYVEDVLKRATDVLVLDCAMDRKGSGGDNSLRQTGREDQM